ncbi:ERF family protein [Schleiferilactobacillus perolens]|jgi:hypothetical protein|uniref:ERF family protein n=1 Tax=Schleiferilactobacillus perolens TaxID=100468 RepID=UPI0023568660|nr:ERF family protein [Schleiferilactobacillus perolens]MCI2172016.1 ERF family protein [Schleiferilactobacillus perolens]
MTEAPRSSDLTVVSKVSKAMALIHGVDKDGKNSFQHYDFQSESAIKHAVKAAIEPLGVIIMPSYEVIQQYDRKTQKGTVNHFVDVMGTFKVTDGVTSITGKMPGSGQDTGEKAMAKACTSAQKYFYKQLFNITDRDEDPDTTDSTPDGGFVNQNKQMDEQKPKESIEEAINKQVSAFARFTQSDPHALYDQIISSLKLPNKPASRLNRDEAARIYRYITEQTKALKAAAANDNGTH